MTAPSVAIVGSGPSGCYLAQALRKQWSESEISIYDRLPVPYGLVRYGVAPDHPGTKAVARQFERLFTRDRVNFYGNVQVGRDITLDELRAAYDVVVLATGLYGDRAMNIPGETLAGVYRSGPLTRLLNDHPDEQGSEYRLGQRCVIVGNGNVAIDVLRLLSKSSEEFVGSEVSACGLSQVQRDALSRIDIVGRSPLSDAKFDTVMVKELAELSGVNFIVHQTPQALAEQGPRGEVLQRLAEIESNQDSRLEIHFHFGWTPVQLEGASTVERIHFSATGHESVNLVLEADSVVTAIGFAADPERDFNRDALTGPDADVAAGRLDEGLYCTGWFKRGPRGTIPENRMDSKRVAEGIIADFAEHGESRPGYSAMADKLVEATDFAGWRRIDACETDSAPQDRLRCKLTDLSNMVKVARQCDSGEQI